MAQRDDPSTAARGERPRAVAALFAAPLVMAPLLLAPLVAGCSLSNISPGSCQDHDECRDVYGYGSACINGYCGEPTVCSTGRDCRQAHGGGACVESRCVDTLPADPLGACTLFEPEDMPNRKLIGADAPMIIGGMYLFEVDFAPPIQDAARLAVREINKAGGLENGQPLAMVICDNGGTGNALDGQDRLDRIHGVVDYLAGTLGVPLIVGPLTSGDSQSTIQYMVAQQYPTVMVSPSATSPSLTNEPDRLNPNDALGLFWRTAPPDDLQGQVLAVNVAGTYPDPPAPVTSVAAVYRDDAYGLGLANAFQIAFPGATTLQRFDVGAPLQASSDLAASINPDAVLFIDIGGDRALEFINAMAFNPALNTKPLYLADGSKNATLLDTAIDPTVQGVIYNNAVGTVAAPPEGPSFNLFSSSYQTDFGSDPADSAFTANGYDAVYVGVAGIVYAASTGNDYDGRDVAEGMSRLVGGPIPVEVGQIQWPDVKNGLTTGEQRINIVGVSGPLDFDVSTGQAAAAIEVWKPSDAALDCPTGAPCFQRLTIVNP